MPSILRQEDEKREKILTNFIIENLFPTASIIEDKELQIKGVDIIRDNIKIDLKGQISDNYINNPRPTFALELLTNDRTGTPMIGWFLDNKKITDRYGFCWIPKGTKEPFAIDSLEYMEIDIKKLKEYLAVDMNLNKMYEIAQAIQGTDERYKINQYLSIVSSPHLVEQPVNLVVNKEYYKQTKPYYHLIIHKN